MKEIGRREGLGVILTSLVKAPAALSANGQGSIRSNEKSPRKPRLRAEEVNSHIIKYHLQRNVISLPELFGDSSLGFLRSVHNYRLPAERSIGY